MASESPDPNTDGGASFLAQQRRMWTLERFVAVINLFFLVVGGSLVWWDAKYHHLQTVIEAGLAAKETQNTELNVDISDTGAKNSKGLHLYDVKYSVKSTNVSKVDADYTYSILNFYRGHLPMKSVRETDFSRLNAPPPLWAGVSPEPGAIAWTRVGCVTATQVADQTAKMDANNLARVRQFLTANCPTAPIEVGGGLTGRFPPGVPTIYSPEFLIWAAPDELLGTSLGFGLDGELDISSEHVTLQQDVRRFTPSPHGKDAKR